MTKSRQKRETFDYYREFVERIDVYMKRLVHPTISPETWQKLREELEVAYVLGRLSDNEHDELMNQWSERTGGSVGDKE